MEFEHIDKKKITLKNYQFRKGKKQLGALFHITNMAGIVKKVTFFGQRKYCEKIIIDGKISSETYFDENQELQSEQKFEYYENGKLKESKFYDKKNNSTKSTKYFLDFDGELKLKETDTEFSFYANYFEHKTQRKVVTKTTYSKSHPFTSENHLISIYNGELLESSKEHEELDETEEGYYLTQNHFERQYEYYSNGNNKRFLNYSCWGGKRILTAEHCYNKDGFVISVKNFNYKGELTKVERFDYTYNADGQWTEKKHYVENELHAIWVREIEDIDS